MPTDDRLKGRPEIETYVLPDGSCLLFDPARRQGHVLEATGALAWDYCDGTLSSDEIADEITALVPNSPTLRGEAISALEEFAQRGLLVSSVPAELPD
jgi:hypothetical protein